MTPAEIEKLVLKTISTIAPESDLDSLKPDVVFRDQIQFDSVDCVNFIEQIQKTLDIKIPETDYPQLTSLNGCIDYLR